ncbi:MAG: AtpZ/AtpI family protein [Alphaproteobacteria bacterium]|nr:AtpZ/AtpI family protein [Alphaproteobacteria bacterium]
MTEFDKTDDKKVEKMLIRKAELMKNRPNRTFYADFGMVASLGGVMTLPIIIGILVGAWLDKNFAVAKFSWRLNLMIVGFFCGLYYAYRWVKYQGVEKIDEAYRKERERLKK